MFKNIKNIGYHILIFILSAAIALSFPYTGRFIADNYRAYWNLIESKNTFLVSVEIVLAVLLSMLFNFLVRVWKDRKFSRIARNDMGLVLAANKKNPRIKKQIKKFMEKQSIGRDVMLMGSTGCNTFVNPASELHLVIQRSREAKIMLQNPFSEAVNARANSIPDAEITVHYFKEEIKKSVDFLKNLKKLQKNIKLKFYDETPLFKLIVCGDYIGMKYYHPGLHVNKMPEYIFRHSSTQSSLFHPLYHFFLSKWRDSNIPEYDFDADALVYRNNSGSEVKREKLDHSPAV